MSNISELWHSGSEQGWKSALENYWNYVQPGNVELERRMNDLQIEDIVFLNPEGWFRFLHDQFFRWKYTAPNRYATTTKYLKRYMDSNRLEELFNIKKELLALDLSDIAQGLSVAKTIHDLGIPGASGLLSLMYPRAFATVDKIVVKALCEVRDLPEHDALKRMNSDNITLSDGILLIYLMRHKAEELNHRFGTNDWSPRKIDMVLWATRSINRCPPNQ
jgi:hypothetical protein